MFTEPRTRLTANDSSDFLLPTILVYSLQVFIYPHSAPSLHTPQRFCYVALILRDPFGRITGICHNGWLLVVIYLFFKMKSHLINQAGLRLSM